MRTTEKARQVRFRCEAIEQDAFAEAARLSGVSLSEWVRSALREAAERRLANAGKVAPWVVGDRRGG